MSLDRTWWNNLIDDDGSGTTGTVWNKYTISGELNMIDALFSPPVAGAPTDASGAGLALTAANGIYRRIDRVVFVAGMVQYPSTTNGSGAKLGGLPFPVSSGAGNWLAATFSYMSLNQPLTLLFGGGTPNLLFYSLAGAQKLNSELSTQSSTFTGFFFLAWNGGPTLGSVQR